MKSINLNTRLKQVHKPLSKPVAFKAFDMAGLSRAALNIRDQDSYWLLAYVGRSKTFRKEMKIHIIMLLTGFKRPSGVSALWVVSWLLPDKRKCVSLVYCNEILAGSRSDDDDDDINYYIWWWWWLTGSFTPPHFVLSLQESIPSAAFALCQNLIIEIIFITTAIIIMVIINHHRQDCCHTSASLHCPTAFLHAFFSFKALSLSAFGLHF